MEKPKNMSQIFEKIDDLKAVFSFGERIVPVLQGLIEFMKDVVPLLEKINTSIASSTSQMPGAANQIADVTNATELATTEILDIGDQIASSLTDIEASLKNILEKRELKTAIIEKLTVVVKDNPEAVSLIEEYKSFDGIDESLESIKNVISKINDDLFKITLSLQVQDITSQQLAAVNHLIGSVNEKLTDLVDDIDKSDLRSELTALETPENAVFDANARYDHSSDRQDLANDIIDDHKEQATQDEIDKLFG